MLFLSKKDYINVFARNVEPFQFETTQDETLTLDHLRLTFLLFFVGIAISALYFGHETKWFKNLAKITSSFAIKTMKKMKRSTLEAASIPFHGVKRLLK